MRLAWFAKHGDHFFCAMATAVFLLFTTSIVSANTASSDRDDFENNTVLANFLLRNDIVMSRVLGNCKNIHVRRYKSHGYSYFEIKEFCLIKREPPADLDCPGYDVYATGTIDDAVQATIRKLTLSLRCTA